MRSKSRTNYPLCDYLLKVSCKYYEGYPESKDRLAVKKIKK